MKAVRLGRMEYAECYSLQKVILELVSQGKLSDVLLFVEHPPVYSLGANFHAENLPLPTQEYEKLGVAIEPTDRGGDITYHGPGQVVAYPIFHLENYGKDLHVWLRNLEEWVIQTLAEFGVESRRFAPHTGVWVEDRKICAIGIKVRRWVSMHGIALNVENDLKPFDWIIPCGIKGYRVTSLSQELKKDFQTEVAEDALVLALPQVFGVEADWQNRQAFLTSVNRLQSEVAHET